MSVKAPWSEAAANTFSFTSCGDAPLEGDPPQAANVSAMSITGTQASNNRLSSEVRRERGARVVAGI
jgi:hypothetical protein